MMKFNPIKVSRLTSGLAAIVLCVALIPLEVMHILDRIFALLDQTQFDLGNEAFAKDFYAIITFGAIIVILALATIVIAGVLLGNKKPRAIGIVLGALLIVLGCLQIVNVVQADSLLYGVYTTGIMLAVFLFLVAAADALFVTLKWRKALKTPY